MRLARPPPPSRAARALPGRWQSNRASCLVRVCMAWLAGLALVRVRLGCGSVRARVLGFGHGVAPTPCLAHSAVIDRTIATPSAAWCVLASGSGSGLGLGFGFGFGLGDLRLGLGIGFKVRVRVRVRIRVRVRPLVLTLTLTRTTANLAKVLAPRRVAHYQVDQHT